MSKSPMGPRPEGTDTIPWYHAPAPQLQLERVPAVEALCRVTEGAKPSSVWELVGLKGARSLGLQVAPISEPGAATLKAVVPSDTGP
jgi:hypothetical protein